MWHSDAMTDDAASSAQQPGHRGLGALLQTDVEHVELGEHSGRALRARVEHRTLRLALGRQWSGGVTLGRRRATAVEVTPTGAAAAARYDVLIPTPADPWPRTAQRLLAVAFAGWIAVRLARRLRGRTHEGVSP